MSRKPPERHENPLERIEEKLEQLERQVADVDSDVDAQSAKLDQILGILTQEPAAQSLLVQIIDSKGNIIMPATVVVGGTFTAVAQEWSGLNGTGVALPPAGAITFASSDTTIATVDPVSGAGVAVGPGTATISATDAANGLTGSDVVSDTPLVAQSMTVAVTAN